MKNLLTNAIACAIVMTSLFSCSVESIENEQLEEALLTTTDTVVTPNTESCIDQDPQARITNNGTITLTLQIASTDGTILHTVENIAAGTSSGYLTFAPDEVVFNIVKNTTGIQDDKVVFTMGQCMSYDMVVGADNNLIAGAPVSL
nr:hypothetical protein [uncultured Psychroserpens sp.]